MGVRPGTLEGLGVNGFRCRSCGSAGHELVLSLGRTPLANALLTEADLDRDEPRYPLDVVRCRQCALVQITESVPPESLFREYAYFSSFSDTMVAHAEALAARLIRERALGPTSRVIEVASNDGYLLQHYARSSVPVLGIEPALNIAQDANARGIETISEFFGAELGASLRAQGIRASVLHAHNVLAHVPDLNGFAAGIALVLADEGVAVIEVPYLRDLIDRTEFDTIYHEHLSYFAATPLARLFERNGLVLRGIERVSIHGGSLRLFVERARGGCAQGADARAMLEEELAWGVDRPDPYVGFAARVERLKLDVVGTIRRLRSEGRSVAAYGAAAKGCTLLSYFGLGREDLDFVADRSPHKQGRYMPGAHLPIVRPEHLLEARPDYVLLLTWNFADEILLQQAAYRELGGRFIVPIPELRIV